MEISKNAHYAIYTTLLCFLTYLSADLAKNILSATSAQMLVSDVVNRQALGIFSSAYFI